MERQRLRRLILLGIALLVTVVALTTIATVTQAATFTWNVASGAWTNPASWSPARVAPAANDILVFDGAVTPAASATGIQNETIGQLHVIGGAQVSLAHAFGIAVTVTLAGDAGTDLEVAAASLLTLTGDGSGALQVSMGAGVTGAIAGELRFTQGSHRLLPTDAGSVTFAGGSMCNLSTGLVGNPFGTAGTNGVVLFQSGSTCLQGGGSSPFGPAGVTRVVFLAGSLYRVTAATSGLVGSRTFSHFEWDSPILLIGALTFTTDDFTILQGGFRGTTPGGILTVRGNLTVQGTGQLEWQVPGTLLMSGASPQTIAGTGSILMNAPVQLTVSGAGGVVLARSLFTQGNVSLSNGRITTGPHLLHLGPASTLTTSPGNWVVGRLGRMIPAGSPPDVAFEVGDAARKAMLTATFASVSDSGTLIVSTTPGDHPTLPNAGLDPAKSVNRTWSVSNAGVAFTTCDATLSFDPLDLDLGANHLAFAVGKNDGGNWTLPAVGTRTATSTQALGLTSFSELAAAEIASGSDQIQAAPAPGACISNATPCVAVPVTWNRVAANPARAYSVEVQLSANLSLCGAQAASGGYLVAGSGGTSFLVTPLGGNRYIVDETTLGVPCGATGSGTLFTLHVSSADAGGSGTISVLTTVARDCANLPVPAHPGAVALIDIDHVAPVAVANLAGAQVKNGNDADGTTKITVSFTAPGDAAVTEVWRRGFGGYPQYDENGGAAPVAPASYPPAGWTLTGLTASGQQDEPATRDFWSYVVYTKDACGNVSAASNVSAGRLNYHLGDTHDGTTNCAGNNLVNTSDIAFLGANYGVTVPINGAAECVDVGPTTDFSVDARPTTDNVINFEDLIVFAINYGEVSSPQARAVPVAAARNALRLSVPSPPAVGETFAVALEMEASGTIQGFTSELTYDRGVVDFVGVEAGALLGRQAASGIALSSRAGVVDVALLGTAPGLVGTGTVAEARFRVKRAGDPSIALRGIDARDAANRPVALEGGAAPVTASAPSRTALAAGRPTPFHDRTVLEYALARDGAVELAIYAVDGRKVRTLEKAERAAGVYRASWDGRDDHGAAMPAGMYYARMVTGEGRFTRTLIRVR